MYTWATLLCLMSALGTERFEQFVQRFFLCENLAVILWVPLLVAESDQIVDCHSIARAGSRQIAEAERLPVVEDAARGIVGLTTFVSVVVALVGTRLEQVFPIVVPHETEIEVI